MVHALRGIWRVLASSGILVDLRPLPGQCPIELVSGGDVIQIGEVDATGMAADDEASDQAIQNTVSQGYFVAHRDTQFDFGIYWESVQEMRFFLESSRRMKHVSPSYADCEKAYAVFTAGREHVRLRCRRQTTLGVYEKVDVSSRA